MTLQKVQNNKYSERNEVNYKLTQGRQMVPSLRWEIDLENRCKENVISLGDIQWFTRISGWVKKDSISLYHKVDNGLVYIFG